MKKIFLSLFLATTAFVTSFQYPFIRVFAENSPITSAITSPITSAVVEDIKPVEKPKENSTQGSSNGSGGSSNSSSSNNGTSSCTNIKPNSAPRIYRIKVDKNTATLLWTMANSPVTGYSIEYGRKSGLVEYTTNIVNGTEYTIGGLNKNTSYYFKVRGFNGCMPGDYSNEVFAKISGSYVKNVSSLNSSYGNTVKNYKKTVSNKPETKVQVKTEKAKVSEGENTSIFNKIVKIFSNR